MTDLITQWIHRLEAHKKKIATEEKITETKLGAKTAYYIKHAEEHTLSSKDPRRITLFLYKHFALLIEHINKEKNSIEQLHHLLERAKANFTIPNNQVKQSSLLKIKQLITDFEADLNNLAHTQKKSGPSDEIKR